MNIVGYNIIKFQEDNKLSNKKFGILLGIDAKMVRILKRNNHHYTEDELNNLSKVMGLSIEELTSEMNERIDLKKRKIYGTDYFYLGYKVNSYHHQIINYISASIDILFFIMLAIFIPCKLIDLSVDNNGFLGVLKVIFGIELLVFPFMFFAFPGLKIYFSRTYDATLTTKLKEDYKQDEACGIVLGCLRRSINKSTIPFLFTMFSEIVIGLYCLIYLMDIKTVLPGYLIMIILCIISLGVSIYAFKYHFSKNGTIVRKE